MGCAVRSSNSTSTGSLEFIKVCRNGSVFPFFKGSALILNLTSGLMRSELSHNDL